MSLFTSIKRVDPEIAALLAAYQGPITRVGAVDRDPSLSASDLVRSGEPLAGAWKAERSSARRVRRAARLAAIVDRAAAGASF